MTGWDAPDAIKPLAVALRNDLRDLSQRGRAMIHAFGEWELDIEGCELRYLGNPVRLNPKVFDVLAYLVLHRDRMISKQELMSRLWPDQCIGVSAVERCIMVARKTVDDSRGRQKVIKTFRRHGYRFVKPVTERPTRASPSLADTVATSPSPARSHHLGGGDRVESGKTKRSTLPESPVQLHPERQQATVLSCSLVDAHELAEICTPEEKQILLAGLFDRAMRQMQGCGGLITQLMNDGFLALFGVTTPRENHALRAVKAALELQALLSEETFNPELPAETLAVRMGLHTGEVIGKRFSDDPRVIYMSVGNTMQFAANLQACTDPGSVLVSGITYGLVQEVVHAEVVGLIAGNANAPPVAVYRLDRMRSEAMSESSPTTREGVQVVLHM